MGCRAQNTGTEEVWKLNFRQTALFVPVLCQDIAYIIHEKESLKKENPAM